MTQISGKIYQMTNDAGTENRFPRTVIEAVYGLSSYLQGQFSNLSTIYMPIEGIAERKTDQSFVFRQTPNTIHANTLQLERIKGKSLAWNQLVNTLNVAAEIYGITRTLTADGKGLHYSGTSTNGTNFSGVNTFNVIGGHKYYYAVSGIPSTCRISKSGNTGDTAVIQTKSESGFDGFGVFIPSGVSIDNDVYFICIDLTLLYGSEINGLTDEQILAKYEAEFGDKYYPYNNGDLICNDAKYLESAGFNQWDEEWEVGAYNSANGAKVTSPDRIRSKNYIHVLPGALYFITKALQFYFYDADFKYISWLALGSLNTFTPPTGACYMTFNATANSGTTYNNDICINISDPDKNGTYEPYWKRVLHVNCDSFKVKSHNIWDEEWEVGSISGTGVNQAATDQIRSKNYIPAIPSTTYYFKSVSGTTIGDVFFYDINKNFISGSYTKGNQTFTTPDNCYYIRIAPKTVYGSTYNNDICINLSGPFNGQYEPHGEITVNGLYGRGTSFDEKTAVKYYKRRARVNLGDLDWSSYGSNNIFIVNAPSNANKPRSVGDDPHIISDKYAISQSTSSISQLTQDKSIAYSIPSDAFRLSLKDSNYSNNSTGAAQLKSDLNDVYLDYELATTIEYELVEPMVTTMKVGITESRVSPNAYGLSAPFVADINYSVNPASNGSESAEYAPLAARLLNTRKIWGQDFNGSQDVAGALSGVTNVNSLLYFDSANGRVGIGTSSPDKKLTVSGTLKVTDAVTLSSSLSVGTNAVVNGTMSVGTGNSTFILDSNNQSGLKIYGPNNAGYLLFNQSKLGINTTPTHNLHVIGDIYASSSIQSESYITAGLAAASSDARLKDNLKIISQEMALSVLSKLSGKEWDWNEKMETFQGQHGSGLVAQELQVVMPWAVLDLNGQLSLNYNTLWGIAVPVMQSHEERIKRLEERIGG